MRHNAPWVTLSPGQILTGLCLLFVLSAYVSLTLSWDVWVFVFRTLA